MLYRSHRGGVYYTPENTMPAFQNAIKEGFHYIETDPCFTSDGVIVLFHDGVLNRTCRNADGSPLKEKVFLSDISYPELMKYDAGIYKGEEFRGTKVPTLYELLSLADGGDTIIALDKKIPTDQMEPLFKIAESFDVKVCYSCADIKRIETVLSRIPDAMIDYDGVNSEKMLKAVTSLVPRDRLIVWVYMDKPNFSWLTDRDKASLEVCRRVKEYARLGLGNVSNPYDMREALSYEPDVLEV